MQYLFVCLLLTEKRLTWAQHKIYCLCKIECFNTMVARCQSPWACRSYKWCSRRWMERHREDLGHQQSCTVLERYIHIHITYSGKIYDVKAAHSKPNDLITWIFKRPRQTGWLCLQVLYPCAQKCCWTESDTATWMDKQSHFRNTATERSVLNYSRHVLRHWRNTATNTTNTATGRFKHSRHVLRHWRPPAHLPEIDEAPPQVCSSACAQIWWLEKSCSMEPWPSRWLIVSIGKLREGSAFQNGCIFGKVKRGGRGGVNSCLKIVRKFICYVGQSLS